MSWQRIPEKFSSKHGKNLGKLVFLKVPSGATWTVELANSNGEVWLCNGWKEFSEYYSICFGHFLVFRYEGNSNFHVLIFDTTASEIEYPFHGEQSNMNPNGNLREPETDVSIEILDEFPICRMRKTTSNRADNEKDVSVEISEDPPTCRNRRETKLVPDLTSCEMMRTKNIPMDFAKKYLNGEQNSKITLRISEGRTWTVKRYSTTTSGKCTLSWSSFARDNNLKVGDVCAFELDTGIELSLNVTIFRAGEYQNDDRKDKVVI
ncbi:B3 domain-containing protein [Actinidia chinensis var. chinensis]|uniref:B3 domain-containing protein n=1 Tax=Actinidia chinensis var. chinensis TaxID=1590841 RepID=A0A2R6S2D7_ACTCC|nr:B3 domain-containing protein [Actinidia chinensis var. chinensis]